ncbi:hypothetical protein JTB14_014494 [Gonioctena quinquepunctata]|nr:hypothetical protein JTB14_014494 [Gonioctena quinquepunctata]
MGSSGEELPDSILEAANSASLHLFPAKSAQKYEIQYKYFEYWYRNEETNGTKEEVFLAYFADLRKIFHLNSSRIWVYYIYELRILSSTLHPGCC